jgi:drug/metabolite transporter (DMT)-like permease
MASDKLATARRRRALLEALLVTFLWSTSWVLIKLGLRANLPSLTFAGLRYCLAFLCLLPWVLFQPRQRAVLRHLPRRLWASLAVFGLVSYTLAQGAQFVSLGLLPSATVSLVLNLSPLGVAGLAAVFTAERPNGWQWLGAGLSVAGSMLYFLPLTNGNTQWVGLGSAGLAMLANAFASILGRDINHRSGLSPILVTTLSMGFGAWPMLALGLAWQGLGALNLTQWLIIAWLALVNTAFAFTLWNRTLQTLSAVESSLVANTMLPQIVLLTWIFLGESLDLKGVLGLVLVTAGVALVQWAAGQKG